jgi:hypothetical protein
MKLGSRVRLKRAVDLGIVVLKAGETGTVTAVCPDTGETWITLDRLHWELAEYANAMWITPFISDDYADAVEVERKPPLAA